MCLLIAGGRNDPNLSQLAEACRSLKVPLIEVRHDRGKSPSFEWDLSTGEVRIDGQWCQPVGAFIRHDVFEGLSDPRAEVCTRALAWHQAVNGWLLASPSVRILNRSPSSIALSKPATLIAARQAGLTIPRTLISNAEVSIRSASSAGYVTKPVAGGDYCYHLSEVLARTEFRDGTASCPGILQRRLVPPEVRIYVIGNATFAFEMRSTSLDYRLRQDAEVIPMATVPAVASGLRALMATLNMEYGAADFKSDEETGELVFLELNSSPMFARFDLETGGRLSDAIVTALVNPFVFKG